MLSSVCFGTNDLTQSGKFYDAVLEPVGLVRLVTTDNEIGYGSKGQEPTFWVLIPFDRQKATHGNGTQVIFNVDTADAVDRFHQQALEHGGQDEGAPGLRDHTPGYYGAYCRDPDGNKLHSVAMLPV